MLGYWINASGFGFNASAEGVGPDNDEDGINDYEEWAGYISDLDWKTYFTDNTSESTDRDPYDDGQELDGHSPADLGDFGGQMPASVKAPGRHPLVPSYPDLKVEIGGMDVVAKCKIESTTTKEEGSSWSIIPVVLEKASVKWGKENKGGSACLFGFCVGGSTAKNYYNYEHETFVEMVNSTSGWSRETWSLATAYIPGMEWLGIVEISGVNISMNVTGSVGGTAVPVSKFGLLAPWIGLAGVLVTAVVATVVLGRHKKRP